MHPNASSKDSKWRSVLSTEEAGTTTQGKTTSKEINWRAGLHPVQEVIRAPRGPPPSDGKKDTKGPTGFQRLRVTEKPPILLTSENLSSLADKSQPPLALTTADIPVLPTSTLVTKSIPVPVPAKEFTYENQEHQPGTTKSVQVGFVTSKSTFYVQFTESAALLDCLTASLNDFYCGMLYIMLSKMK